MLGTFESLASTVKASLTESLMQILSPKRRVDILRDVVETQRQRRPYVMAFCGVNGVGKSTNLAKVRRPSSKTQFYRLLPSFRPFCGLLSLLGFL